MISMFREIYDAHVRSTERQWPGGRNKTVGASEIGQCARRVWWVKHNEPHDVGYSDSWGARVRGSIFEEAFWVKALRLRYGANLKGAGAEQRTLTNGYLSATPDGLVINQPRDHLAAMGIPDIGEGKCFLTECKTRDSRSPVDQIKEEHRYQLQVQLSLVRTRSPYRPEVALISYTDSSWWHDVRTFWVRFDPAVPAVAQKRATDIMTAPSAMDLPPEGWISGGSECGWCPYAKACGVKRTRIPGGDAGEIDTPFAREVALLAREAKKAEAEADDASTRARALTSTLKARMQEQGVRKASAAGVSVTWSSVKPRAGWKNEEIRAAAEAAGIDLAPYAITGEASDRLQIRIQADSLNTAPANGANAA